MNRYSLHRRYSGHGRKKTGHAVTPESLCRRKPSNIATAIREHQRNRVDSAAENIVTTNTSRATSRSIPAPSWKRSERILTVIPFDNGSNFSKTNPTPPSAASKRHFNEDGQFSVALPRLRYPQGQDRPEKLPPRRPVFCDLAAAGDETAASYCWRLKIRADARIGCGHCDRRCPFHTVQSARMREIAAYLSGAGRGIAR